MSRPFLRIGTALTMLVTAAAGLQAAAPANDAFANATVRSGNFWLDRGSLHGASSELNEPILTGFPNGPTIWWRWTAPATGSWIARTWGSEDQTMVAIYRGATLDTTRLLAYASSHASFTNSAEAAFSVTAGETYSLQVLGADYASPFFIDDPFRPSRVRLSLSPTIGAVAPPSNDSFANALVVSGSTVDVVVNTAGAGSEAGEPGGLPDAIGNTVWLSWTAPSSGVWQIDTQEGDHDTITAVYTGTAVNTLTRLDFSDDASPAFGNQGARGGQLNLQATAGQTYRIQIQGATLSGGPASYGNVRVLMQPVQPPANDAFASPTVLTGTAPTAYAWSTFATREAAEPPTDPDESRSLWWQWTVPATGLMPVVQYDGTVEPYTGSSLATLVKVPYAVRSGQRLSFGAPTDWYPVTAGTVLRFRGTDWSDRLAFGLRVVQPPANDDFADRKTLTGSTVTDSVDMEYGSWETNEPLTDSLGPPTVWYRWTAPSSGRYLIATPNSPGFTRVKVYTGSAIDALTAVGEEHIFAWPVGARGGVRLTTIAGTEYVIQLHRETFVRGLDQLLIRPLAPPANDAFASAIVMTGSAWSTTASNIDATSETNEPFTNLAGYPSGATLWWRWTAPAGGLFRISSAGSAANTVLGVFTGTSFGALTRVADDLGSGWNGAGAATIAATAGTTYQIQIDGEAGAEGAIKLTLAPLPAPANDSFASRLPLTGLSAVTGASVLGATVEAGEPSLPGATVGHSVWFDWTAPASGTAIFQVTATRFSPAVGLFSGSSLGALTTLLTTNGGGASTTEQTFIQSYPVSSGQNYKLLVDGSPVSDGSFQVSISMPATPPNDAFSNRIPLTGAVVHSSADNTGATKETNEPAHAGSSATFSVWWEWTAPSSGTVTMDTSGGTAQARLAVYTGTALNALTPVASEAIVFPKTYATASFTATAGTKYVIAADGNNRTRGQVALNIVMASAVAPNDAFAAAIPWTGDQAEVLARPQGATAEAGEPAHGGRPAARSLWWKWTPQTSRRATFWMETESATFLARLAVYKGSALNSLTALTAGPVDTRSQRRQVDVVAGETYYIALDVPSGPVDPGWVKMGVTPTNGAQAEATPISPNSAPSPGSFVGATNDDGLVLPTAQRHLWWYWVAEVNARMELRTFAPLASGIVSSVTSTSSFSRGGSAIAVPGTGEQVVTFDAFAGVTYFMHLVGSSPNGATLQLVETERQVPPANDLQYHAQVMAGASWSLPVTLGAESLNRLYWDWTAPTTGVAEISLTGTLADGDSLFAYADGQSSMTAGTSRTNGGPPVIRLSSQAGQRWLLVTQTDLKRLRAATLSLVSPAPGAVPANDSFLAPQVLASSWISATGDVTFASCEPGERDHSVSGGTGVATKLPPGRSVWFDWTPPVTGPVTLRLDCATDLAMRLYRGRTQPEWFEEAYLKPGSRLLTTSLVAGEVYHIAVATRPYEEKTAPFTLLFGGPANDPLANALVLTGNSATSTVNAAGATVEAGEPGYGFNFESPRASLWWKWTAPSNGAVWIDTLGTEYDTVLTVFTADPPDLSSRIAENDNATTRPGVLASAVRFPVSAGQSYLIRVCRRDAAEVTGLARLSLSLAAPAEPYARWLSGYPTLTGNSALEIADPDGDGIPNLLELAFGTDPRQKDSRPFLTPSASSGGWQIDAALDRDALEALTGGTALEVIWEVSSDLKTWRAGPLSQFLGRTGRLSQERVTFSKTDPPFARLTVRRLR